ncbi:MAG: NADH-ubiquinone dehydrogenase [Aliihoeflea sp.]|uniref:NADH-ubiquinone dehydrogenase n=1 Tax=Aliihoeflea sp. TaxID=2608088 RepID=UPI0040338D38
MAEKNPFDDFAKLSKASMPDQFAGMANLMAHPVAGMAAASAIGFGMASHAFGLWMGAMAGATEASRRMLAETEAENATAPQPRLKLVSVNAADEVASLARTVEADVEKIARDASVASTRAAEALLGDVKAAAENAMRAPVRKAKPARPDDLKAISGVGPKLEQVLNGFGIWTYGQVAALVDAEIAWLEDQLGFGGRIDRDGWVQQAKSLASGPKSGSKGAGRKRS